MKLDAKSFGYGFCAGALGALLCGAVVGLIAYAAGRSGRSPEEALWRPNRDTAGLESGDEAVVRALTPVWQAQRVPALAGAILTGKGLDRMGAVGVRKVGMEVAVTRDDDWHLGSNTKAMTATVVARLVEQGALTWETTVAELFPELTEGFHPELREVTLLHLLSHRAGLPANLDWDRLARTGTVQEQRVQALIEGMAGPPVGRLGEHYEYSNLGYVIVGAVMERVTHQTWEELMEVHLFHPLGMERAGFGGTGTPGQVDQPWGHRRRGQPVRANGPAVDNRPVLGPSGRVHCPLEDWARFVADQLRGIRGEPALLRSESYKRLFTPPFGGDYALGWAMAERDWGGGTVFHHAGSNTLNFANVWLAPARDFAVLVCLNQGDEAAATAADEAVWALIQIHQQDAR